MKTASFGERVSSSEITRGICDGRLKVIVECKSLSNSGLFFFADKKRRAGEENFKEVAGWYKALKIEDLAAKSIVAVFGALVTMP